MPVVGFDVGNKACYIAVAKHVGNEIVRNEHILRGPPSVIGFTSISREIGLVADAKIAYNLENTVFGFKTILGTKYNDSMKESDYLPVGICEMPDSYSGVRVNYLNEENTFSILQIMAMLLCKLKSFAEDELGSAVRECVISVPVFYTDTQRRFMLDAAEIAGLKPLKLVHESTAAALYYGFDRRELFEEGPKIVVFVDLGESALTATAFEFSRGKLKVLGSVWNTGVGGRDFDRVLVKHFSKEIESRYNVSLNKESLRRLFQKCEILKKQICEDSLELGELWFVLLDIDECFHEKMDRLQFEKLSSPLFDAIQFTLKDLMVKTELQRQNIYEIKLIGGSSRIPALKNIVYEVFGQDPSTSLDMQETVARGCALQCAILSPTTTKTEDFIIEDIQPYDVLIRTTPDEEFNAFPLFHQVPAFRTLMSPYKPDFSVDAFYSQISGVHPSEIAKVRFSNFPPDVEESSDAQIEVKIRLNEHGILDVTSAELLLKQNEQSTTSMADLPKSIAVHSLEDSEGETVLREKTKSHQLTVDAVTPTLPRNQLYFLSKKEQEMIDVDIKRQDVTKLRGIVKDKVDSIRMRLNRELKDFVSAEEKAEILNRLKNKEVWLIINDIPEEKEGYDKIIADLDALTEPLETRCKEFRDLMEAFGSFTRFAGEIIALSMGVLDLGIKMQRETDALLPCINEIDTLSKLPLKASDVQEKLKTLQRDARNVISSFPFASDDEDLGDKTTTD